MFFLKFSFNKKSKKLLLLYVLVILVIIFLISITLQAGKNLFNLKRNQNNSKTTQDQQHALQTPKTNKQQALPTQQILPNPLTTTTPIPTPSVTLQNNNTTPIFTASKQNFSPNFSVSVNSPIPSAASEVNLEYGSNNGDWLGMGIKIVIPPGWEITAGTQLGQNMKIGEGVISAKLAGEPSSSRFVVYNQVNTEGHKAKWLFKFDNETYGERTFFVDGDKDHGHLLFLDGTVGLPFSSPVSGKLTIFSNIITNPPSPDIYEWKIQYLFADGILEVKKEVNIR